MVSSFPATVSASWSSAKKESSSSSREIEDSAMAGSWDAVSASLPKKVLSLSWMSAEMSWSSSAAISCSLKPPSSLTSSVSASAATTGSPAGSLSTVSVDTGSATGPEDCSLSKFGSNSLNRSSVWSELWSIWSISSSLKRSSRSFSSSS